MMLALNNYLVLLNNRQSLSSLGAGVAPTLEDPTRAADRLPSVVRGYDPERAAASFMVGEGGEEIAFTSTTQTAREAAEMGVAQAALLTDEESFQTSEEFARKMLGLGKRELSKIKKDIVEQQKNAYEQRLVERMAEQAHQRKNCGTLPYSQCGRGDQDRCPSPV